MDKKDLKARIFAIKIVRDVMFSNSSLKSSCSTYLNNHNLSSLDIRFIMEISKGTIRMSKRIEHEISRHYKGKINNLEKLYLTILKVAFYQLDYMNKVPDHAVVSTSVDITKKFFFKYSSLTNALLRNMISNRKKLDNPEKSNSIEYLSIYYSHPEWLIEKWLLQYKFKSLIKLLTYNNKSPKTWFRYDKNKVNFHDIKDELKDRKLEFENFPYLDNFFTIKNPSFLLGSKIFNEGGITVQSPTNGLIVKLLDPLKDEEIVDLCAAPGGKTIAISECMFNTGKIVAYDINRKKKSLILKNLKRNQIKNVTVEINDSSKDKIIFSSKMIADVPCLGTGTISKNVDLKWKKTVNDLTELTNLQEEILNNSSGYLNSNGVLVYSTCSIEDEENWMIIDKFLKNHPNYTVDNAEKYVDSKFTDSKGAINIKPQTHDIDGGFAVRLINCEN